MSGLIQVVPSTQDLNTLSIEWTSDDVPASVQLDLRVNPKLFPRYVQAMKEAIGRSLNDPRTRPAILNKQVLKTRIQDCHKAIQIMREEMLYPLRRCLDVLPRYYITSLLGGERIEDIAEKHQTGDSWSGKSSPEAFALSRDDLKDNTVGLGDADVNEIPIPNEGASSEADD